MKCTLVSIDLAKTIVQICGLNDDREVMFNKKVRRSNLLHELRKLEPTRVVMEACYSSNPWGRRIQTLGHHVECIPAFLVKPFVVGGKNDANDALAIAEAALRPKVRFVQVKSLESQDVQSLSRIRELQIKQRTAMVNQLRGLLSEYGLIFPKTPVALLKAIPGVLERTDNELTVVARGFIQRLYLNVQCTTDQIQEVEKEIAALLKNRDDYKRLCEIPGVGPVVSAGILSNVTDVASFKNGRQFACWLGITPSQ